VPVSAAGPDGQPLFELPGKTGRPLPLLAYSSGAFLGNVVEMLLMNATEPYSLYRCFETHMSEALKGMVVAGHGIGWLPESCIAKELHEGTLVRAGSNAWATELEIRLYRPVKQRGQAAEQLWAYISNQSVEPAIEEMPEVLAPG
jgi:DNA-binding transcriptional LysR family regulator